MLKHKAIISLTIWALFCFATGFEVGSFSESKSSNDEAYPAPSKQEKNYILNISPEGWTAVFTGTLTLSTALLWLATLRADDTNRISANAAKQAADALPVVERAYVFVSRLDLNQPQHGRGPHFNLGLTNHGRTPAIMRGVRLAAEFTVIEPLNSTPVVVERSTALSNVIGSNVEFNGISVDAPKIDSRIVDRVKQGLMNVRVKIDLSYEDIFGTTHTPSFDYMFDTETGIYLRTGDVLIKKAQTKEHREAASGSV